MMRRSSGTTASRGLRRRADGTAVVRYERRPGHAPVSARKFVGTSADHLPQGVRHAHDFHVFVYLERGSGKLMVDDTDVPVSSGDLCLIAPGQVVSGATIDDATSAVAWIVFFTADAVAGVGTTPLSWRHHPLLSSFATGDSLGPRRLSIPDDERAAWSAVVRRLAAETPDDGAEPAAGAREAATAALTLLLVSIARLVTDGRSVAPRDPSPTTADPLVAAVLAIVEERFRDPVSTRDVAQALGYTTGHLTTVVRERTGRTVLDWLTERRMIEARRLLVETDLPVALVAERTGHRDAAYLVRRFRALHGTTPTQWRRTHRQP